MAELREAVVVLSRSRRLPGQFATQHRRTSFDALRVVVSVVGGRAQFMEELKFDSPIAAAEYAILRLSQITTDEAAAVLVCDECGKFKIIESTGGDRISRFCSARCRNAFTVRNWRARKARKSK